MRRLGPSNLRRQPLYQRTVGTLVSKLFLGDLVLKTNDFADVRWLGRPVWQSVLDLWTIQEAVSEVRPDLLVETGTHRGGSALFYAHLLDALDRGRLVTVDVERLHERVGALDEFLLPALGFFRFRQDVDVAAGELRGKTHVLATPADRQG